MKIQTTLLASLLLACTSCSKPSVIQTDSEKEIDYSDSTNLVYLKNRVGELNKQLSFEDIVSNSKNSYVIFGFNHRLGPTEQQELENAYGVKFIERISRAHYIINIASTEAADSLLNDSRVVGALELGLRDKIGENLNSNAQAQNYIIHFFSDVPKNVYSELLTSVAGISEVSEPLSYLNAVNLTISNLSQLAEIARIEEVQWIEADNYSPVYDLNEVNVHAETINAHEPKPIHYGLDGDHQYLGVIESCIPSDHISFVSRLYNRLPNSNCSTPDNHAVRSIGMMAGDGSGSPGNEAKGSSPNALIFAYSQHTSVTLSELDSFYQDGLAPSVYDMTAMNNSWGTTTQSMLDADNTAAAYNSYSNMFDGIVSGRDENNNLVSTDRLNIVASAGNDNFEILYSDVDGSGAFNFGDCLFFDSRFNRSKDVGYSGVTLTNAYNGARSGQDYGLKISGCNSVSALSNAPNSLHVFEEDVFSVRSSASNFGYFNPLTDALYIKGSGSLNEVESGDFRVHHQTLGTNAAVSCPSNNDCGSELSSMRNQKSTSRVFHASKNGIVVANHAHADGIHHLSSGIGPTLDGRLQPMISAPGSKTYSLSGTTEVQSVPTGVSGYSPSSGTSISAPYVTGVVGLLHQWATNSKMLAVTPAMYRAALAHGAEDGITTMSASETARDIVGPDFATGYGSVNTKKSLESLTYLVKGKLENMLDTAPDYYDPDSFFRGACDFHAAGSPIKVTLAWDDPPKSVSGGFDPASGFLVNDLNLRVTGPDGRLYFPWKNTTGNPFDPMETPTHLFPSGTYDETVVRNLQDHRNTLEQVYVENPVEGQWCVEVMNYHSGLLEGLEQEYALIWEGHATSLTYQGSDVTGVISDFPQTDMWIADNDIDTGAQLYPNDSTELPNVCTGSTLGSPASTPGLWVRNAEDGIVGHETPVAGTTNYLYSEVTNLGPEPVYSIAVEYFEADGVCGSEVYGAVHTNDNLGNTPTGTNFKYLGTAFSQPTPVSAPSIHRVGPIEWTPSTAPQHCIYARVVSPQESTFTDKIPEFGLLDPISNLTGSLQDKVDGLTASFNACRLNNVAVLDAN